MSLLDTMAKIVAAVLSARQQPHDIEPTIAHRVPSAGRRRRRCQSKNASNKVSEVALRSVDHLPRLMSLIPRGNQSRRVLCPLSEQGSMTLYTNDIPTTIFFQICLLPSPRVAHNVCHTPSEHRGTQWKSAICRWVS